MAAVQRRLVGTLFGPTALVAMVTTFFPLALVLTLVLGGPLILARLPLLTHLPALPRPAAHTATPPRRPLPFLDPQASPMKGLQLKCKAQ